MANTNKTTGLINMILSRYGKEEDYDQIISEAKEQGILRTNFRVSTRVSKANTKKSAKSASRKISAYNVAIWQASKTIDKNLNVFSHLAETKFWDNSSLNPKSDNFNQEELDKATEEYKEAKGISDVVEGTDSDSEGSVSNSTEVKAVKSKRKPSAYNKFIALHKDSRPEGVNMFDYVKELWADSEYNKKSDNFNQEAHDAFMAEE